MKMKTKFNSIAFLLFLTLSFSCSSNLEGEYNCCNNNIILPQENIQFSSENNSVTITTKGKDWWLNSINLDGKRLDISHIDFTAKQYKITEPEFTFERKNSNDIIIVMNENNSKKERKLNILLQYHNILGYININQLAIN